MKYLILLFLLIPLVSVSQEVNFEKKEIKIMRKTDEQNIPVKVMIDNENTNTSIEITQIEKGEITLNPQIITYTFNNSLKEYVFNFQVRTFPESDLKKEETRIILRLKYKKGVEDIEKLLLVRIIPFEVTTENFPEYILFTGTNIDPLGDNLITSSSAFFDYNFKLTKKGCSGINFGLYTNKNFSKDSSMARQIRYFAPDVKSQDGLVLDKSKVYTQLIDQRFSTKVRTFGGYINTTFELDIWEKTKTYFLLGGEIIQRRFSTTLDPKITQGDTLTYNKQFENKVIASSAVTKESFFSPPTIFNQALINVGLRIENSSKDFYFLLQPIISYGRGISSTRFPDKTRVKDKYETSAYIRVFATNKPTNISMQFDYRIGTKFGGFANFSIGFPLDIKGAFSKK